jgi:hypothetical protein
MDEATALALLRSSADNEQRGDAAEALGDAASAESFDALVHALGERSPLVRLGAERALARRSEYGAAGALARVLDGARGELAERIARILATRTDACAEKWVRSAIALGAHIDALVKGLDHRRDPGAVELLGEIWTRFEEAQSRVAWALQGADLEPIADLLLCALDRAVHSAPLPYDALHFATSVLASRPEAEALSRARPMLVRDAWRDEADVARARAILAALEARWAELSEARIAGADARTPALAWRTVVEPLATHADRELAALARALLRALDWFEGTEPFPRVLPFTLLEFEAPFAAWEWPYPFVVLGFEVAARVAEESGEDGVDRLALAIPAGPRLVFFSHQFGGILCRQSRLLGYAVGSPGLHSDELIRLFKAWSGTQGDAMTEPDRLAWGAALGPAFPPIVRGEEARLESAPLARFDAFEGSPVLEFCPRAQPWRAVGGWSGSRAFDVADAAPFAAEHARVLGALAAQLDVPGASAFVLWSSSD